MSDAVILFQAVIVVTMLVTALMGRFIFWLVAIGWIAFTLFGGIHTLSLTVIQLITIAVSVFVGNWVVRWRHADETAPSKRYTSNEWEDSLLSARIQTAEKRLATVKQEIAARLRSFDAEKFSYHAKDFGLEKLLADCESKRSEKSHHDPETHLRILERLIDIYQRHLRVVADIEKIDIDSLESYKENSKWLRQQE